MVWEFGGFGFSLRFVGVLVFFVFGFFDRLHLFDR